MMQPGLIPATYCRPLARKRGDIKSHSSVHPSVTKTLTLAITFALVQVELWYLACVFFVTRRFWWYHVVTLMVTFDLLQGQICCRAGDHNSLNLLVMFSVDWAALAKQWIAQREAIDVIQGQSQPPANQMAGAPPPPPPPQEGDDMELDDGENHAGENSANYGNNMPLYSGKSLAHVFSSCVVNLYVFCMFIVFVVNVWLIFLIMKDRTFCLNCTM